MPFISRFVVQRNMGLIVSLLVTVLVCLIGNVPLSAAERPQRIKTEAPPAPPAPAILSIIPAQGEPGTKVTIFGSSFGDKISVYLGSIGIPAKVIDGRQLEFTIPQLDAGLYALHLRREDGAMGRAYNFTVMPLRPVLRELSPPQISACAQGRERDIIALGQNFSENSLLLFDGAVIKSSTQSSEAVAFTVPQVAGGLHQVVVRNGPENASVAVALAIETKPEINQVTVGNEYVNYYELVITGRNFQQGSAIYVDGQRIGGGSGQEAAERERLIFSDCTKLIYLRYPYSPVNKDFRIQVINPGNEASQVIHVTAP